MPGLVNIHNHTPLMITRGMIEDIGYAPAYTPGIPQGHHLTAEDAYLLSRLGMYELLRAGCTTVVDYYRYPESCARAAAELGLRAVIGGRIHDVDVAGLTEGRRVYSAATRDATMAESDALIARWDGHDDGRIRCDLAPHAPDTCSRDLLREIATLAARRGGNVHTHLAQSADEVAVVKARDGMTPAELLEDAGLLTGRLIAAHCIWLEAPDIARVGRSRAIVAHSPIGNAKSGTIAPIRELRAAGARITLCTDGFTGDLFEAMRWAIAMLRVRGAGFEIKAREVLRWATAAGAEALGYGAEIGALEVGRRADILLVDATSPRVAPIIDGAGILVHSASGNDVRSVIVDGRVCIDDGALVLTDGPTVVREAQRAAERLWRRAGRVAITEPG
jgi:5-methylthioadenosine/S-adenosylhomocysteine deaminase